MDEIRSLPSVLLTTHSCLSVFPIIDFDLLCTTEETAVLIATMADLDDFFAKKDKKKKKSGFSKANTDVIRDGHNSIKDVFWLRNTSSSGLRTTKTSMIFSASFLAENQAKIYSI